jgi:prepilin-type processing-associated H-X9-DG protein
MKCQNNLKQISLATHNFHDANLKLPSWGFDFPTNPNPANPYGDQRMGHNILTVICPYVEQGNLLNITKVNFSVVDSANLPPPYGVSAGGGTKISIFVCPSAQDRMSDYIPYFASKGVPNMGPMLLAVTDYNVIRGLGSTSALPTSCLPPGAVSNTDSGPFGKKSEQQTLVSIGDGTSNTIMFAETAGRQQVYFRGQPVMPNNPGSLGWQLNAAWADYNTSFRLRGYGSTLTASGCDTVNAANYESMYSFHTGGANVARCDGSIVFLRNATSSAIVAAMVTANGGEVVPGDAW